MGDYSDSGMDSPSPWTVVRVIHIHEFVGVESVQSVTRQADTIGITVNQAIIPHRRSDLDPAPLHPVLPPEFEDVDTLLVRRVHSVNVEATTALPEKGVYRTGISGIAHLHRKFSRWPTT